MKNKLSLGLMAAAAVMVTMAFVASSASATTVTPTNKKVTATLQEGTHSKFFPKNAYDLVFLSCQESKAQFTTQPGGDQPEGMNQNQNLAGTGFHSQGQGSVSMQIQGANEKPKFEECTVRFSEVQGSQGVKVGTAEVAVPANVATKWTIAFEAITVGATTAVQAAVGVPQAGAIITISSQEPVEEQCKITIGEEQQSVVMGDYVNATQQLRLDGQLKYTTEDLVEGPENGCEAVEGLSPAQFEAEYKLTMAEEQKFTVE